MKQLGLLKAMILTHRAQAALDAYLAENADAAEIYLSDCELQVSPISGKFQHIVALHV